MIITSTKTTVEPERYSVSRLKSYLQCSEYYKLKYIDKISIKGLSNSTILGGLCHNILEIFFSPDNNTNKSLIETLKVHGIDSLIKSKVISNNVPDNTKAKLNNHLYEYGRDMSSLYNRASKDYKGKDAIRKKDGGIALAPQSTTDWKKAEEDLGLVSRKLKIDEDFSDLNIELEGISISSIYAEAYSILSTYKVPEEVISTKWVEFPISDYDSDKEEIINAIRMPQEYGGDSIYLNGYIDWIGMVSYEGVQGLAIIDYKTSKEKVTTNEVAYNVQLYSYVYAYESLTGEEIKFIGINSLRHKELVLVPVDRDKMKQVLAILFSNHHLISNKIFRKHIPDSTYSPCHNQYGDKCKYLRYCYPDLAPITPEEELRRLIEETLKSPY